MLSGFEDISIDIPLSWHDTVTMTKRIKNKTQHEKALKRIYQLMQTEIRRNSKEEKELEMLTSLVEAYERKQYPISLPA
jgi:antitoxin component HigA of HigAB toxin-antitoxin module